MPDTDEDNGSDSPVYDVFRYGEHSDAVLKMTNFSVQELDAIWTTFSPYVLNVYNVGRGRKCRFSAKDVFFMILVVLKHAGKWDFLAKMFGVKGPTFERMITSFIHLIQEQFYEIFVGYQETRYPMKRLIKDKAIFSNFLLLVCRRCNISASKPSVWKS